MSSNRQIIRAIRARQRALSLPEILVAVSIIAILAVVAGVVARGALGSSREKQTTQTMKVLQNALTTYKGERKQFPTDPYVQGILIVGKPLNGRMLMGPRPYKAEDLKFRFGTGAGSYVNPDNHDTSHWPTDEGHAFGEFAEHLTVMMQSAECKKTLLSLEGSALKRRLRVSGSPADRYVWTAVDAWGHEILYRVSEHENNGFPILLSAGPDETYATEDDIRSDGKPVKAAP